MSVSLIKHLTYRADHPVSQKIASLVNIFGDVLISKTFHIGKGNSPSTGIALGCKIYAWN